jgi:DNA-binding transcriptional MocR family regulator
MSQLRDDLRLTIDEESDLPTYLQISRQLREGIQRGDFPLGTQLPPERTLARALGVSRTTVVSAYDELEAEGLIEGHVGRGTIVTSVPMDAAQPIAWPAHFTSMGRRLAQYARPSELLTLRRLAAQPGVVSFSLGLPDPDLLLSEQLGQAWEGVLQHIGTAAVSGCPPQGMAPLREEIAARMRRRDVAIVPESVAVVNGSQHGLDLLLRLLAEPGDVVLVETPTYFGAIQSFLAWGVRLVGVPVDQEGMDVDRVASLLARYRPRFIYTVPTYQNPTGVTMSLERRERLLALAQQHHVPIVEDDPFSELFFDAPPPPPIKALDRHGHVLYLGTFSKTLAPGLRVGWLAAPAPIVDQAALLNQVTELQPNTVGQHLAVEFARRGWLDDQVERARITYRARCRVMDDALGRARRPGLAWTAPTGGMFLWLMLPDGVSARELLVEAGKRGVTFLPGGLMYPFDGPDNVCRLNFSVPDEAEIERGVGALLAAVRHLRQKPVAPPDKRLASGPIV